jgi:hypothetical protein
LELRRDRQRVAVVVDEGDDRVLETLPQAREQLG